MEFSDTSLWNVSLPGDASASFLKLIASNNSSKNNNFYTKFTKKMDLMKIKYKKINFVQKSLHILDM